MVLGQLQTTPGVVSTRTVFVLEEHRGQGLAKWLIGSVVAHPELAGVPRFMLATRDAHGLYSQFGFAPLPAPERMMGRIRQAS